MKRSSFFTAMPVALLMFSLAACTGDTSTETESATTVSDEATPEITPGTYTIDAVHSNMGFRARHLGISNVDGRFTDVEGTVTLGDDLASMQAEATIQVNSIDTRNSDRDDHLRSPDFFDAASHPTITFTSTSVEPLGGGRFQMNGDLTIRGTTQPITLEGEYLGGVTGPQGSPVVAFSSETEINRMDYGVSWNNTLDTGGLIVGEMVGLTVNVEAASEAMEAAAGCDGEEMAGCDGAPAGCDGEPMGCDGAPAGCDGEPMGCDGAAAGCDGEPMGCDGEPMGCDGAPAGCDGEPMGGCN